MEILELEPAILKPETRNFATHSDFSFEIKNEQYAWTTRIWTSTWYIVSYSKSDMLNMTFQNVVIFWRSLHYQRKIVLSVCTHFFSGDSQLRSEHVDILLSSVFIKPHEKLRISGPNFDSNTQKNANFTKVSLLSNDHNAMNGPIFFSRPYRLFFLPFLPDVNTFKRDSSKFQKLPIFPVWSCFVLWDRKIQCKTW